MLPWLPTAILNNQVVKFSVILLKNGIFEIHGDSGVQHYINIHCVFMWCMENIYGIILDSYWKYENMSQNHKNGQTTQTSNVKTARLIWVIIKSSDQRMVFQSNQFSSFLSSIRQMVSSDLIPIMREPIGRTPKKPARWGDIPFLKARPIIVVVNLYLSLI